MHPCLPLPQIVTPPTSETPWPLLRTLRSRRGSGVGMRFKGKEKHESTPNIQMGLISVNPWGEVSHYRLQGLLFQDQMASLTQLPCQPGNRCLPFKKPIHLPRMILQNMNILQNISITIIIPTCTTIMSSLRRRRLLCQAEDAGIKATIKPMNQSRICSWWLPRMTLNLQLQ